MGAGQPHTPVSRPVRAPGGDSRRWEGLRGSLAAWPQVRTGPQGLLGVPAPPSRGLLSPLHPHPPGLGQSHTSAGDLRGSLLTKDNSFPLWMAMADSRAPVVEKVQQLPQPPWRGRGGGQSRVPQDAGFRALAGSLLLAASTSQPGPLADQAPPPCEGRSPRRRFRFSGRIFHWPLCSLQFLSRSCPSLVSRTFSVTSPPPSLYPLTSHRAQTSRPPQSWPLASRRHAARAPEPAVGHSCVHGGHLCPVNGQRGRCACPAGLRGADGFPPCLAAPVPPSRPLTAQGSVLRPCRPAGASPPASSFQILPSIRGGDPIRPRRPGLGQGENVSQREFRRKARVSRGDFPSDSGGEGMVSFWRRGRDIVGRGDSRGQEQGRGSSSDAHREYDVQGAL